MASNGNSKNVRGGPSTDGFRVPSLRWRQRAEPQAKEETPRKRHIRCIETENQETDRRKAKDGTGMKIIKTGILKYNMTGILTDERRDGNSETKEWNDKNFKRRSTETGKIKIRNLTVDVYNTREIKGTKLRK